MYPYVLISCISLINLFGKCLVWLSGNGITKRLHFHPSRPASPHLYFWTPSVQEDSTLLTLILMPSNNSCLLHSYGFLIDQFLLGYKTLLGCLHHSSTQGFLCVSPSVNYRANPGGCLTNAHPWDFNLLLKLFAVGLVTFLVHLALTVLLIRCWHFLIVNSG